MIDVKKLPSVEVSLLVLGVILFLSIGFYYYVEDDSTTNKVVDFAKTVAGVFAFFSVMLVFVNMKKQSTSFRITQFDNNFFKMIEYHRSNVENMLHVSPETKDIEKPILYEKNRVFLAIYREMNEAVKIVNKILVNYSSADVYTDFSQIPAEFKSRNVDLLNLALVDISYCCIFFGVGFEGKSALEKTLKRVYNQDLIDEVILKLENIPVKYSKYRQRTKEQIERREGRFYKYFEGHQHRLGHYFRHLYQSVKYIDGDTSINMSYPTKYQCVKKLRAHFSTYEQGIFFLNTISQMGTIWEFSQNDLNEHLVTKYNLIKNIPVDFINYINVRSYYPDVKYEGLIKTEERLNLEKKYK